MFKKLDKLIVKAFIGPFFATFFITLLVLVMQFFWLYIDDFVGKGLGTKSYSGIYLVPECCLVPLALPLAVLLSSLMTFGNLGESFELVAIKSAGFPYCGLCDPFFCMYSFAGVAFVFSNYVIPVANLKSKNIAGRYCMVKTCF